MLIFFIFADVLANRVPLPLVKQQQQQVGVETWRAHIKPKVVDVPRQHPALNRHRLKHPLDLGDLGPGLPRVGVGNQGVSLVDTSRGGHWQGDANAFVNLHNSAIKQRQAAVEHAEVRFSCMRLRCAFNRFQQAIATKRKKRVSETLRAVLHQYELLHNDAFSGNTAYKNKRYKFLVWRAANGVADQMLSLVSAFALALLTDRVLIAHSALTAEFVSPFYYGWMEAHPAFYIVDDMLETKLYGPSNEASEKMMCLDPRSVQQKSWRVSSAVYFGALLWRNPFVNQTLADWCAIDRDVSDWRTHRFPDGNMFATLSDYLLANPNAEILNHLRGWREREYGV
jgi:hypothetical protein